MLSPIRRVGRCGKQLDLHMKQFLRRGKHGVDLVRRRIDEIPRIAPAFVEEVNAIKTRLFEPWHDPLSDDQAHLQFIDRLATGLA